MKFDDTDLKTVFARAQAALVADRACRDGLNTSTEDAAKGIASRLGRGGWRSARQQSLTDYPDFFKP